MKPDASPFLAAIRVAPDDDAPRLIYADWLDEHGQPERAEFIRVQCELARRESPELRKREAELLARYHDAFAGPLAAPGLRFRFRRGFVARFGHAGVFVSPEPVTGFNNMLRLYPDGHVIGARIRRTPPEVIRVFRRGNREFASGSYVLDALIDPVSIHFACNAVQYRGTLEGIWLHLETHNSFHGFLEHRRYKLYPITSADTFSDF